MCERERDREMHKKRLRCCVCLRVCVRACVRDTERERELARELHIDGDEREQQWEGEGGGGGGGGGRSDYSLFTRVINKDAISFPHTARTLKESHARRTQTHPYTNTRERLKGKRSKR